MKLDKRFEFKMFGKQWEKLMNKQKELWELEKKFISFAELIRRAIDKVYK